MAEPATGARVTAATAAKRRPAPFDGVVMTRTPLRLSFAGGGTDLAAFYDHEPGAVFSTAIARYIYVTVKRHSEVFNEPIRLNYSRSEEVHRVEDLENNIARECMRLLEIEPPIYISTVGDLPASTGLGGSSSFAVGLLNALHVYRGERVSAAQLAEEACHVEIEVLGEPIGKQDQYAAAFGGLNLLRFRSGGRVGVEPQRVSRATMDELFDWVVLYWTGHQRDAAAVLGEQKERTMEKMDALTRMRDQAERLHDDAHDGSLDPVSLGRVLEEGWQLKRELATTITNPRIDAWHDRALEAGAIGGKLCGAGSGGFFMFLVPPERQDAVRRALHDMLEIRTRHEGHGSQVVTPFMS